MQRTWSALPAALLFAVIAAITIANDSVGVKRVVDGDTLVVEKGERVRLIGVDTPETKHPNTPVQYYGKEATEFVKRMVEGKPVRLEYDPANAVRGHKDNCEQHRTLAYVYLEDGTLLNAKIIRQGYGFALTRIRFRAWRSFVGWTGKPERPAVAFGRPGHKRTMVNANKSR